MYKKIKIKQYRNLRIPKQKRKTSCQRHWTYAKKEITKKQPKIWGNERSKKKKKRQKKGTNVEERIIGITGEKPFSTQVKFGTC